MRLILYFFLLLTLPARAQQFTAWSLEAGLPQSQVYALCEDRNGYLWLGTQGGGVSRFDGIAFTIFNAQQGLGSNYVHALYEDQQGGIWAGTNEGAARFDGKQFQVVSGNAVLIVYAFVQPDAERLLLGTATGIWQYVYATKQFSKLTTGTAVDNIPVYALHATLKNHIIWLGTSQGIWCYNTDNQKIKPLIQSKFPLAPVRAFAQTGAIMWCAQTDGTLIAVDWAAQTIRTVRKMPVLENTTCLLADRDGSLWAGTQTKGLFHLSAAGDSVLVHFTEAEGLPHNHVRVLQYDHTGRLWLGTSGGGFACMGTQAFRHYDRGDGLPGVRMYALHETPAGAIWLAMSQNGLATIDSTGQMRVSVADSGYLQGVKCRTLESDQQGNLWAGTEGKGALCITPAGLKFFRKDNGFLPSDWVQKIMCDAKGTIWIATGPDLVRLDFMPQDSSFIKKWYTAREGMPAGNITTMRLDAGDNLWFATSTGKVGRLKNGKVDAVFGTAEGLPALPISAMAFDAAGRCWVATKGAGILVNNTGINAAFTTISTTQTLSSKNIYLLTFDASGNLWAGTESGVDQLVIEQGKITAVHHFGKQEGFSGIETCQDAGLCDRRGRLWFGTMNGLMRYVPQPFIRQNAAPLLHFEQVILFYKPIEETQYAGTAMRLFDAMGDGLLLPWNQNHLSFAFKAIELQHDTPLLYRWKLDGPDAEWSPWSTQTQVNYANLAPGSYRLLVEAASDDQTFSEPAFARFTIGQPFWQEWYFRLGVLCLLAGIIIWGTRTYIQRIRRAEAQLRAQLEIRNRLLTLEQKALQLQMNPHFIFNALNSIQSLIATQDYAVARQEINHFARLMRSILHNSRKATISLQEEIDTLQEYLHIEQFCHPNPFTFLIQTAADVHADTLEIPPMLLQPFVENAVVHGVSNLSYPGHIELYFAWQDDFLVCTITDNGLGREQAALLQDAKKPGHQSAALSVTSERLTAIGGRFDLRDRDSGNGTVVEIRIKITA